MVNASEIIEGKIQKGIYRMAKKYGSEPYETQILIGFNEEKTEFIYKILRENEPPHPITFKEFMDIGRIDLMQLEAMFEATLGKAFMEQSSELECSMSAIWFIISIAPLDESVDKLNYSLYQGKEYKKEITIEEIIASRNE
jgi:hypothetical protein